MYSLNEQGKKVKERFLLRPRYPRFHDNSAHYRASNTNFNVYGKILAEEKIEEKMRKWRTRTSCEAYRILFKAVLDLHLLTRKREFEGSAVGWMLHGIPGNL